MKSWPVHWLIQQVLCYPVPLQLNAISQLGCDCFSPNPESLFNRHPSTLQRDEIKKKTVNSSKIHASTLKTTQCQPRRPTMKLPITMKKLWFYLMKLLEGYGFLGHVAK